MLGATTSELRLISLEGIKATWKVIDPEDVVECNGAVFVKVNPVNNSLKSIVLASNPAIAELGNPSSFSMSANRGLRDLIALRNRISEQMETAGDGDAKVKLFDGPLTKRPRSTITRGQQQCLRDAPESILLPIEIDGEVRQLQVLKSVHPSHKLAVKYDNEMMSLMLYYLRIQGFDDKRIKSKLRPKGIHVRKKGGFFVMRYNPDGSTTRKLTKTYSDAVAEAHENPSDNQAMFPAAEHASGLHPFPEGQLDPSDSQSDGDLSNDDNDDDQPVVESSEQDPVDSAGSHGASL